MAEEFDPNIMATVYGSGPSEPARMLEPGDRFADRYEVVRQLGSGGMGLVYLVRDGVTGEEVALKLIHPSFVDEASHRRLVEEGLLARKVSHPNVVRVFDVGEHEGQIFLTMEFVDGQSLRGFMAKQMASGTEAPLPIVVKIVKQILAGLAAAHKEGLVHRDVKPENVVLAGDPGDPPSALKILDFGIARGIKTGVLTGSQAVGTQLYMAPEQATTPSAVGPSADIYSVGRMLYEMLMDVLPDGTWNAPSEQRADVPAALDDVIRRALQPPKRRYQSADEFALAIDEAVTKAPTPASEHGPDPKAGKPERDPEKAGERKRDKSERVGGTKSKFRRYALIGAGIVGVLVLASAIAEFDTQSVPVTPPTVYDPDPEPPPEPEPVGATDRWIDDNGNVFQVRRDGDTIRGEGIVPGWGHLRFNGALNGSSRVINSDGQEVGRLTGSVEGSPLSGHWNGSLANFADGRTYPVRFHINHTPR